MKNTSIPEFVAHIRYKDGYVLETYSVKLDAQNVIDALDETERMFYQYVKSVSVFEKTNYTKGDEIVFREIFRSRSCGMWKLSNKNRMIYNEQNDMFILE